MKLANLSIEEAVKAVREGKHPSEVMFEGLDAAIIKQESASSIHGLIADAGSLIKEAATRLKNAYEESGHSHAGIESQLEELDAILVHLEDGQALVAQTGALKDPNRDVTKHHPDEYRDPNKPVTEDFDMPEDGDEGADTLIPADETDTPEGMEFEVKGVQDTEAFQQALNDLVQEHGGVLGVEDEGDEFEGGDEFASEEIKYVTVGKDTKLKDGTKPADEVGNPKGEADKAIKKIETPDKKKGAVSYKESKVRRSRLSEGMRYLLGLHRIQKKVVK